MITKPLHDETYTWPAGDVAGDEGELWKILKETVLSPGTWSRVSGEKCFFRDFSLY